MNKIDLEVLKKKEMLSVKEVAILLNCSEKSIYRNIHHGRIKAVNFGKRLTRIKRSDIDNLFD
ncbi:helix-turn-helix domain-containing protein [Zhouia spongiae]|uniref:Helix-turn-helix domain-containing protein n=1 Tax=Zhouia spongiae TaxID=2202721 RepID=A0ABY3YIV6_9FLAO|nr:helix-turn-helix domain-containing protein [Zhouia spongiae]UNY97767.1 helix-turn-helix domain-containing protein [Zhouia spongiae]